MFQIINMEKSSRQVIFGNEKFMKEMEDSVEDQGVREIIRSQRLAG